MMFSDNDIHEKSKLQQYDIVAKNINECSNENLVQFKDKKKF